MLITPKAYLQILGVVDLYLGMGSDKKVCFFSLIASSGQKRERKRTMEDVLACHIFSPMRCM